MGVLHGLLAWLAAASLVALLVAAVPPAVGATGSYRWLDRALLVQLGATGLAALTGVIAFAAVAPPVEPLHLLYGAIVTVLPVTVRIAAQGRPARLVGRWVAVAALLAVGATLRSFMTGS